jgi:inhibitor of KinA
MADPTNPERTKAADSRFPMIRDVGLSGVLVTFSDRLSDAANRAALAFRRAIDAEEIPGVVETSTSLTSVFVSYDPCALPLETLRDRLSGLLVGRDWTGAELPGGRRRWRIPAAFGGDDGPQLGEAARLAGLTEEQAIAELTGKPLRVLTIGFAPGMPYLGTLPERWDLPRQEALSDQVPAGAVVAAIRQLTIFTNATPTGWRHLGQSAFRTFRAEDASPFALRPGDEVQLVPVSSDRIAALRASGGPGNGGAECEALR